MAKGCFSRLVSSLRRLADRRVIAACLLLMVLPGLALSSCDEEKKGDSVITPVASPASGTPTRAATATPAASATVQAAPSPTSPSAVARKRLTDTEAGYSLAYPGDWQLEGNVLATQFAEDAQCESVEFIDSQRGGESGPAPSILHSFVQVCAQPLIDGLTLDAFMRQTYGQSLDSFERVELNGVPAYQTSAQPLERMIFLQTQSHRLQIAAAVVAAPERRAERLNQMEEILASFSVISG